MSLQLSILKYKSLTAILLLTCLVNLQAQDTTHLAPIKSPPSVQKKQFLKVINIDSVSTKGFKMPDYTKVFISSKERLQEIENLLEAFHDESYLTATVDSMVQD